MKIELEPTYFTVEEAGKLKNEEAKILSETTKEMANIGNEKKELYRCKIRLREGLALKIWTPNQRSLTNLVGAWGSESKDWVGKKVHLKIEKSSKGQKMIVAYPVI